MENGKNNSREGCNPVEENVLKSISGGSESSFDIPDYVRKNPSLLVNYLNQRPDLLEKLHHESEYKQGNFEVIYR